MPPLRHIVTNIACVEDTSTTNIIGKLGLCNRTAVSIALKQLVHVTDHFVLDVLEQIKVIDLWHTVDNLWRCRCVDQSKVPAARIQRKRDMVLALDEPRIDWPVDCPGQRKPEPGVGKGLCK